MRPSERTMIPKVGCGFILTIFYLFTLLLIF